MFFTFSEEEVVATIRAADVLAHQPWAHPLLTHTIDAVNNLRIRLERRTAGRPITENERGLFFELRYAEALHIAGTFADYEVNCDVGTSTVDFRVRATPQWLVELVSLGASDAMRAATQNNGAWTSLMLSSPQPSAPKNEQNQSEEAEIIKAQERIGEKAFRKGKPVKFPVPAGEVHMIMVDARGFIGGFGDDADWQHIANGAGGLSAATVRYWTNTRTGASEAITGLFEPHNPARASTTIRERIHVIGFVYEKTFEQGEIAGSTRYEFNPNLDGDALRGAWAAWPLRTTGS